jgi:hypothetical protein
MHKKDGLSKQKLRNNPSMGVFDRSSAPKWFATEVLMMLAIA